jgi:hypothetical protein
MFFNKKNKLDFAKKYFVNTVECKPMFYNKEKEVLMVREDDGNLMFIIGRFKVDNNTIVCANSIGYTVSETELIDCIKNYLKNKLLEETAEKIISNNTLKSYIINGVQYKYYKIPTHIAEVIAEWYMM